MNKENCKDIVKCEIVEFYKDRIEYLEGLVKKYKFDFLTGLMGKRDFIEKIDRMFEEYRFADEKFFFVLIDINNLHNINRTQGYSIGDVVIKNTADKLKDLFHFHQIYRISGDEFALLIREYHTSEDEIEKQLSHIDNVTYVIGKTDEDTDFANAKQMFKEVDIALSEKKRKNTEERI